jgi:hypothetical protein
MAHPIGARLAALEESRLEGAQNAPRRWGPGERRILPSVVSRSESLVRESKGRHTPFGCDPTAITFGLDGVLGNGQERPSMSAMKRRTFRWRASRLDA